MLHGHILEPGPARPQHIPGSHQCTHGMAGNIMKNLPTKPYSIRSPAGKMSARITLLQRRLWLCEDPPSSETEMNMCIAAICRMASSCHNLPQLAITSTWPSSARADAFALGNSFSTSVLGRMWFRTGRAVGHVLWEKKTQGHIMNKKHSRLKNGWSQMRFQFRRRRIVR